MLKSVTLYFNTGFGGEDYPATAAVLETATAQTLTDVYFLREDIDAPVIKINAPYSSIKNVDYVKLSDNSDNSNYYYFCVPKSLAKSTTALFLEIDALMSLGGAANLNYISGWQTRGHVSAAEDELFKNTAPEDWTPSEPLIRANYEGITRPSTENEQAVIVSNINLTGFTADELTQEVIEGIVSGQTEPVMYFPKVEAAKRETAFLIYDFATQAHKSFRLPQTTAYDFSNADIKKALTHLFSTGQLELQNSYKINAGWLGTNSGITTGGEFTQIEGAHAEQTTNIGFTFTINNYTIKNNKVFALYREFVLANQGSGGLNMKTPAQVYNGTDTALKVLEWADPSATGKPMARFSYIKGTPYQYAETVEGTQWGSSQIIMEGASGSAWNALTRGYEMARLSQAQQEAEINRGFESERLLLQAAQSQYGYDTGRTQRAISAASSMLSAGLSGNITGVLGAGANAVLSQSIAAGNRQYELQAEQINRAEAAARFELSQMARARERNQSGADYLRAQTAAPTVLFTPSINLALYGYDFFSVYEIRPTEEDIKSMDRYFQRYGYRGLHEPLTSSAFTKRQYYNYVEAHGVNIKSTAPKRLRERAIEQLNSGGRFWRVLPDAQYYETN